MVTDIDSSPRGDVVKTVSTVARAKAPGAGARTAAGGAASGSTGTSSKVIANGVGTWDGGALSRYRWMKLPPNGRATPPAGWAAP